VFGAEFMARFDELLDADDAERHRRYPGSLASRQPVHTVYLAADRFHAGVVAEWGTAALDALDEFGPLVGYDRVEHLVHDKLGTEPIEDLRIDFEDGYGIRPDEVEDGDVRSAATALAAAHADRAAPNFVGIRIKSLEGPVRRRGLRTLELFLQTLLADCALPEGFRVTLPKVTSVVQVSAMAAVCGALEAEFGLPDGQLRFEIQVETPQAVLAGDGSSPLPPMIDAAAGRCVGLHYGTYDYSASVGVAAALQSMEHPAADYAKAVMQVAAAGTGVPVSDGSTNVLPVGDAAAVRAAWGLHARLVLRSLERGFYQGWDLHPAQLPTRFAATFAFFADGLPAACLRLRNYLDRSASGVLDEPATAQALAAYLMRGIDCGAVTEADILDRSGVERHELARLARR
jgi:citrate lyase beta subunit